MTALAIASIPTQAIACSVCFGDPESDLAKGAFAGVAVLAGIVGVVLTFIAGIGLTWLQRSRRLSRLHETFPPGDE